ncbi:MAG: carbon storage regulator [Planctomycetales bacterium]|jgi:sRNA-binding carbon storage regulator CsrA|nr:carbon storage regulator [Planctomycetales bacterium]
MRVYSRGVDEGLLIGNRLQVNVLEVHSDRVHLAIIDSEASPSYREEILFVSSKNIGDGQTFDSQVCQKNGNSLTALSRF